MLQPAVLAARAARAARPLRLEPHLVHLTRDDVGLSGDLRQPEAVDDVGGVQPDTPRYADGQMPLVGGDEAELRMTGLAVAHFPPPLMSGHVERERRRAGRM